MKNKMNIFLIVVNLFLVAFVVAKISHGFKSKFETKQITISPTQKQEIIDEIKQEVTPRNTSYVLMTKEGYNMNFALKSIGEKYQQEAQIHQFINQQ